MEESTIKAVAVFICAVALYLLNSRLVSDWAQITERRPISEIARRDLTMVGDTGDRLQHSLFTWLYSILVICYRAVPNLDVMDEIRQWSSIGIHKGVTFDIEAPYTKFLKAISDAKEEEEEARDPLTGFTKHVEPKFGVSPEYDYHVLPKTLKFNDYVCCESLMSRIDDTLGGAVNE